MPETLDSIAQKLADFARAVDDQFATVHDQFAKVDQQFASVHEQFAKVDQRFARVDQQFAETKAHLGVKIEAVDTKVALLYDAVLAMQDGSAANVKDHRRFTKRLDDHDVRLLVLEPAKPVDR